MGKKILLILLTLFSINILCFAYDAHIPKGFLVKVYPKMVITTENLEEGSEVYFISPADVWIIEQKAIAKGDIFYGHVSMLRMPIQGVNAAMKIKITSIVSQNGEKKPVNCTVIFNDSDILGGDLTNPLSYNRTIHPRKVYGNNWGGTLQYVPSGEYEFGQHVKVTPRDNVFIQFDDDFYI